MGKPGRRRIKKAGCSWELPNSENLLKRQTQERRLKKAGWLERRSSAQVPASLSANQLKGRILFNTARCSRSRVG